jgi:hypothetical protein
MSACVLSCDRRRGHRSDPCHAVLAGWSGFLLQPAVPPTFAAMQIHIKKLDGQKEEFSLEPNDTVMKVKVRTTTR